MKLFKYLTVIVLLAFSCSIGTAAEVWDNSKTKIVKIIVTGSGALSGTLDNAAIIDAGSGTATIQMTSHGFATGSQIYIQGSDFYDGLHRITGTSGTTLFSISVQNLMDNGALPAETMAGTEYCGAAILSPNDSYRFIEARLHASDTAADESITMTLDSSHGANFDCVIKVENINGETSWDWAPDATLYFDKGDILKWTWANGNSRTYGFEMIFEQK